MLPLTILGAAIMADRIFMQYGTTILTAKRTIALHISITIRPHCQFNGPYCNPTQDSHLQPPGVPSALSFSIPFELVGTGQNHSAKTISRRRINMRTMCLFHSAPAPSSFNFQYSEASIGASNRAAAAADVYSLAPTGLPASHVPMNSTQANK